MVILLSEHFLIILPFPTSLASMSHSILIKKRFGYAFHASFQLPFLNSKPFVIKLPRLSLRNTLGPMTASVHKFLIHTGDIIENTVLPIGYFGEEVAESLSKFYRSGHARKDLFYRATDTSDPIISSVNLDRRIQRQKRMSLSLQVLDLLECSSNQDDNTVLEDEKSFKALDLEYQDNVELEIEEQHFF